MSHPLADAPPLPPWPVTLSSVHKAVEQEYLYRAMVREQWQSNPKAYAELSARTNPSLDVECFERLLDLVVDLNNAVREMAKKDEFQTR